MKIMLMCVYLSTEAQSIMKSQVYKCYLGSFFPNDIALVGSSSLNKHLMICNLEHTMYRKWPSAQGWLMNSEEENRAHAP